MSCEKFLQWLDKRDSASNTDDLPEEIRQHFNACADCRNTLDAHNRVVKKLLEELYPMPSPVRLRVFSRIEERIADDSAKMSESRRSFFAIPFWGTIKWPAFALTFSVFIIWALTFYIGKTQVDPSATFVGGQITVVRNHNTFLTESKQLQVRAGDLLKCYGQAHIAWNAKDQVIIAGNAEFIVDRNRLQMLSGKAKLEFANSATGYEIQLRQSVIKVLGTIIHLEITMDHESVGVEHGKIQWRNTNDNSTGILEAGEKIKFSSISTETKRDEINRIQVIPTPVEEAEITSEPLLPD